MFLQCVSLLNPPLHARREQSRRTSRCWVHQKLSNHHTHTRKKSVSPCLNYLRWSPANQNCLLPCSTANILTTHSAPSQARTTNLFLNISVNRLTQPKHVLEWVVHRFCASEIYCLDRHACIPPSSTSPPHTRVPQMRCVVAWRAAHLHHRLTRSEWHLTSDKDIWCSSFVVVEVMEFIHDTALSILRL